MKWPDLIDALRERGWTQPLLAARLGVAQSAISDLRRGATVDPRHSTGSALIHLYAIAELPGAEGAPPGSAEDEAKEGAK